MTYKLIVQPCALADLDKAYQWIKAQSPENAASWLNCFLEALSTLEQFPRRCAVAPESKHVGLAIRQLLYGRRAGVYRALFTIRGREIHVLHIRHAARRTMTKEEFQAE